MNWLQNCDTGLRLLRRLITAPSFFNSWYNLPTITAPVSTVCCLKSHGKKISRSPFFQWSGPCPLELASACNSPISFACTCDRGNFIVENGSGVTEYNTFGYLQGSIDLCWVAYAWYECACIYVFVCTCVWLILFQFIINIEIHASTMTFKNISVLSVFGFLYIFLIVGGGGGE